MPTTNQEKYKGPVPADKKGQSGVHGREQLPFNKDEIKAQSAHVFYEFLQKVKKDKVYSKLLREHKALSRSRP